MKEGSIIKFYQTAKNSIHQCNVVVGRIIGLDSDPDCLIHVVGVNNPDEEYWVSHSKVISVLEK